MPFAENEGESMEQGLLSHDTVGQTFLFVKALLSQKCSKTNQVTSRNVCPTGTIQPQEVFISIEVI